MLDSEAPIIRIKMLLRGGMCANKRNLETTRNGKMSFIVMHHHSNPLGILVTDNKVL